jgi:hypothetical protein
MAEAVMGARAQAGGSRRFYLWMAAISFAVAVLGFMPTYFMPLAKGTFDAPPLVHIHGLILFTWMAFYLIQAWLVASGRIIAHRSWGVFGVALFTAMVFIVTAVVAMRVHQAGLTGQPAGLSERVRAFMWVPFGALLYMIPVFALAIVNVKQPEVHKRLMLLMVSGMLAAPIARWFMTFLAPPPDPNAPPLPTGLPHVDAPPVFVAVTPALVGDLLIVAAMIYDWRTRGRPHRVYVIGGLILLAYELTMPIVGASQPWQQFAAALGRLAG